MAFSHGHEGFRVAFAALLALSLGAGSRAEAQDAPSVAQGDLTVWVQQSPGSTMFMRLYQCGGDCQVMRIDDAQGVSMIIRQAGGDGSFSFVDHNERTIDVLPFQTVAQLDAMTGARSLDGDLQSSEEMTTESASRERVWKSESGEFTIIPTDERRTFTLLDLGTSSPATIEGVRHDFEFTYAMNMLPPGVDAEQLEAAGMDLEFRLRMNGTAWLAPDAPGRNDVAWFWGQMGLALGKWTRIQAENDALASGRAPEFSDMTQNMVQAMATLAFLGLPLETRTQTMISPMVGEGENSNPMAQMILRALPVMDMGTSTSTVEGMVTALVTDIEADLPAWMRWTGRPDAFGGQEGMLEGYAVRALEGPDSR